MSENSFLSNCSEHKDTNTLNNIDPLIEELLRNRGITTPEEMEFFLEADIYSTRDKYCPSQIKNIDKAFEIINNSIDNKDLIYIYGDYDVDGITATAILYLALKSCGADVRYRIPDRLTEGYGMNVRAIEELHDRGCNLIITVDNGINAYEEINLAKDLGMKVVVTDHHLPEKELPNADVILDLHCEGETYPFKELAGAGLAFKLACYIYEQYEIGAEMAYRFVDLAAIGTIADVMPLVGENRIIVKEGLEYINSDYYSREGILALIKELKLPYHKICSTDVSYKIAPAMNAPGRLYRYGANQPIELLTTSRSRKARKLASKLNETNEIRKEVSREAFQQAEEYIDKHKLLEDHILVIYIEDVSEGVVGLVAGQLTEKYSKPSIVFTEGLDCLKASARSIEGFSIYDALATCKDLFLGFGGHEQAAGLSVEKDLSILEDLRVKINEYAKDNIDKLKSTSQIYVDKTLHVSDVTFDLAHKLDVLEPFGEGNPKPTFLIQNFIAMERQRKDNKTHCLFMGQDKTHLKIYGQNFDIVGFGMSEMYQDMGKPRIVDVIGSIGINSFMGNDYLQIEAMHIEPSK